MTPTTPPTPEPRALVLCADDYAMSAAVSEAVRALAEQGHLSATSAMVLSPRWPDDARALDPWRDRLDVGLHLDWTSPFAQAAGHGMSLPAAMLRGSLTGIAADRARAVLERQLDAFEAHWQAPPDHVDGHQHVQQLRGIRETLVRVLSRRYGADAPWVRISRAPTGQANLKTRIIAALGAGALERAAHGAGIPCSPALSGVYDFDGDRAAYERRMADWLAQAPAGTVLLCHPAAPGEEPTAIEDAIAPARRHEYGHLHSPRFRAQLDAAGVQLVRGSRLYAAAGSDRRGLSA